MIILLSAWLCLEYDMSFLQEQLTFGILNTQSCTMLRALQLGSK